MQQLLALSARIDRITDWIGRTASWLALIMVLIGAYNAIVRYLGRFFGWNLSSNMYLELQWYLFSIIFLMGAGYTLKSDGHVRVDLLYSRLSDRGKTWINIIGAAFMLLPFCAFGLWVSWPAVVNSWTIKELSPDPGGLPRYPIKALILIALAMLAAQGLSELIKSVAHLRGENGGDVEEPETGGVA